MLPALLLALCLLAAALAREMGTAGTLEEYVAECRKSGCTACFALLGPSMPKSVSHAFENFGPRICVAYVAAQHYSLECVSLHWNESLPFTFPRLMTERKVRAFVEKHRRPPAQTVPYEELPELLSALDNVVVLNRKEFNGKDAEKIRSLVATASTVDTPALAQLFRRYTIILSDTDRLCRPGSLGCIVATSVVTGLRQVFSLPQTSNHEEAIINAVRMHANGSMKPDRSFGWAEVANLATTNIKLFTSWCITAAATLATSGILAKMYWVDAPAAK